MVIDNGGLKAMTEPNVGVVSAHPNHTHTHTSAIPPLFAMTTSPL